MGTDLFSSRCAAIISFVLFAFHQSSVSANANLFPRDAVLDLVPSSCTQACQTIATSLDTCEYGTCLCTVAGGQALENCMNCLYGTSPTPDIYTAAQSSFTQFQDTCSPGLNMSLNITPTSSSSATTATTTTTPLNVSSTSISAISTISSSSNLSTVSTSASATAFNLSSTSTSVISSVFGSLNLSSVASTTPLGLSSTSTPTISSTSRPSAVATSPATSSQAIIGEYYGKQKCLLVPKKDLSLTKRSSSSAWTVRPRGYWKQTEITFMK